MNKRLSVVVLLVVVLSAVGAFQGSPFQNEHGMGAVASAQADLYNVTFAENGLGAGVYWSVSVNSSVFTTQSSAIVVHLGNGSYNYTISISNTSYRPAYPDGALTVSGYPLSIQVEFDEVTYPVVFNEAGLPLNSSWTVYIGGLNETKVTVGRNNSNYETFEMMNGTYLWTAPIVGSYAPIPENGTIKVRGNLNVVYLQYERIYAQVVFEDCYLPVNTSWYVEFNGTVKYSNYSAIVFNAVYGNYSYSVGTNDTAYHAFRGVRTMTVDREAEYVNVYFWSRNYTVVFDASGLPGGVVWSVRVDASFASSSNYTLSMSLPNGTYDYMVQVNGSVYRPLDEFGTFTVNGTGLVLQVNFSVARYAVTFNMSGLPGGAWSVTLGGQTENTTSSSIVFIEGYGNYSYVITIPNQDYYPSPVSGTAYVTSSMLVLVEAVPVTFPVTFIEAGLAAGQSWEVSLGNSTVATTNSSVIIEEMNGSYAYTLKTIGGYTISDGSGIATVSGAGVVINVVFIPYAYVSFDVSGLPDGGTWTLVVDGRMFNGTSSVITVHVPVGKYFYVSNSSSNFTYSISLPSGYVLANESSFNASSSVVISLVAQSTSPLSKWHLSLIDYLYGVLIALIVAIVTVLLWSRRRGR